MWDYVRLASEQDGTHNGWVMIVNWTGNIATYISLVESPGDLMTVNVAQPGDWLNVIAPYFANSARDAVVPQLIS